MVSLLTVFVFAKIAIAQGDFHPFPNMETRYYDAYQLYHIPGQIFALAPEVVNVVDDTLQIKSFPSITYVPDILDLNDDCYTDDVGWPFRSMEIWPDGKLAFYTHISVYDGISVGIPPIVLDPLAEPGASWIALPASVLPFDVFAEVVSYDTMTVLGNLDSVKSIVFSAAETDHFDEKIFRIGKQTGIISMPGFLHFDRIDKKYWYNAYEGDVMWDLAGIEGSDAGVQNLTMHQAYDFNVGDELHILHTDGFFSYSTEDDDTVEEIIRITNRIDTEDTITYRLYIQARSVDRVPGDSTVSFTSDSVDLHVEADSCFDKIPGTIVHPGGSEVARSYHHLAVWNDHDAKEVPNNIVYSFGEFCYTLNIVDGCNTAVRSIRGLGGGYFACIQFFSGAFYGKELVYYKKGDEEWGEPFDFTVSSSELREVDKITITPNPAYSFINIAGLSCPADIFIFDVTGRQCHMSRVAGQSTINISPLPPGPYFVCVQTANEILAHKFVKHP